ncbi:MAG: Holliday junction resolvase RuvX [Chloroflexi bacterium]|nr:Holliday junction resolvase RuvX [Chloroflexota bacterium]
MTRTLALDVGDRRIGVALSDPNGILASPHTILERRDDERDVEAVIHLISQHDVGTIVVGLPRSMDGSIGEQAQKVKVFVEKLRNRATVPIVLRDERLTTVSARRLMQSVGTKKTRRRMRDDAIAAALILQGYLDEKCQ